MKERLTEISILLVGGIGLIILFSFVYNVPGFAIGKIGALVHNLFH